jgi:hypothetical protein
LQQHKKWNIENGYDHVDILSYLYWIGKFHKNPVGSRFIAGVASKKETTKPKEAAKQEQSDGHLCQRITYFHK